jgi:hypothetical protein
VPIGFVLDSAKPHERLALKGRHPFATYRLVFELDEKEAPQRTLVRALTWSEFPGVAGKVYRALVIGTGAHRLVVRQMLKRIASRNNWGATPTERAKRLPCDALAPDARVRADRAITVDAPPSVVFSWLCQLRKAPYSYDLIDNFGRRSPRKRDTTPRHLAVGQKFMTLFELASFADDEHITLRAKSVAVTYAIHPQGAGSRLHARVLIELPTLVARAIAAGDRVMMRKQLLTLKSLAEREFAAAD